MRTSLIKQGCIRMIAQEKQSDFLKQMQYLSNLLAHEALRAVLLLLRYNHSLENNQEQ